MNSNDAAKTAATNPSTKHHPRLLAFVGACAILSGCSATDADSDVGADEAQIKSDRETDGRDEIEKECGEAPSGLAPTRVNVTRGDVTLHVATQGDPTKQALVLVHGFPDSWCGWARVIPALSKRYFVVAPDLRGYNRSSKPGTADPADVAPYALPELIADVDAVVSFAADATASSGKKPALVAHDWGAIIAWQYARSKAAELPSAIDRMMAVSVPHPISMSLMLGTPAAKVLAVANSSPRKLDFGSDGQQTLGEWITAQAGSTDDAAKTAFVGAQQKAQGEALAYTRELIAPDAYANFSKDDYAPFFERLKTKLFHKPQHFLSEDEQAAHVRMWEGTENGSQKSFEAMAKYYRANLATPLPFEFAVKGIPLVYVAPRYDGAINYPWGTLGLESVTPELTVETVDSGHFVQREAPNKLIALIDEFVDADTNAKQP